MAKSLTRASFGAPTADTLAAIDSEDKLNQLRQANYAYEQKRRDLEDKFGAALAQLRETYLAEVLSIHQGEA